MIKFLLLAIAFIVNINVYSMSSYSIDKISTLNGLSQNDVQDLLQDSFGFVWIATNDGLNRYDGQNFKYYNNLNLGLDTNLTLSLSEDRDGDVWVGTAHKGIYIYKRDENRFFYLSESNNGVSGFRYIYADDLGYLWAFCGINNRLVRFTLSSDKCEIVEEQTILTNHIVSGMLTIGDKAYIATDSGLILFDQSDNSSKYLCKSIVRSISRREDRLFYVDAGVLVSYNLKSGENKSYSTEFIAPCRGVWQGDNLWFISEKGAYTITYDDLTDDFVGAIKEVDSYQNFTCNKVIADDNKGVWCAFLKAGVRRYAEEYSRFNSYKESGNNQINTLYSPSASSLWVGTEGSGLHILESDGDRYVHLKSLLADKTIYSIAYSQATGKHYISTTSGLYEYDNDKLRSILSLSSIRKVFADGQYLWLASYGSGLIRLNLITGDKLNYDTQNSEIESNIVRNVLKDSRNNLWICTNYGVSIATEIEGELLKFAKINRDQAGDHYAIPIMEDARGDIWYGTLSDGLHHLVYDKEFNSYNSTKFTTDNGLYSNAIKGIVEDEMGYIWISSNKGLTKIDPKSSTMDHYDLNDGLLDYEFNELAATMSDDNRLLFGSARGFNYFFASEIRENEVEDRLVLTDFKIFNQSIYSDSTYRDVFNGSIEIAKEIELNHNQNSFSILYTTIDFDGKGYNSYMYKLDGFDNDWRRSNEFNEATYTNIPPGNYIFKLKSSDSATRVVELKIDVQPPYWATWYAYTFYLLLFIGLIVGSMHYYYQRLKQRNAIAFAKMERAKMAELLDIKSRFFTNVSHEFRTPLTLILSTLQSMSKNEIVITNHKLSNYINTITFNGEVLMSHVNDFLSHSKQESGNLKLQLCEDNFSKFATNIIDQFRHWTEQKRITLESELPKQAIIAQYDPHLMQQVIYNLISNAVKHTPADGCILFTLEDRGDMVYFSIKDSGSGIPVEQQQHIFTRFYSRYSEALKDVGGTGIGLSLTKDLVGMHNGTIDFKSSSDEGTIFEISFPKVIDACFIEMADVEMESDRNSNITQNLTVVAEEQSVEPQTSNELKPTMLIVDDHHELLLLLSDLFKDSYSIVTANDGEEGLVRALETIPDVIISDVMMPKMNGFELCEAIKSNENISHIPVVLLTAKSSDRDRAQGYRNQADGYCTKPFNNDVLIERINSIFANRRIIAERFKRSTKEVAEFIQSESGNLTTATDKVFLEKLISYIEENLHNCELVVNDLSGAMGVTPLTLNKKLKSLLNVTANSLIRNVRLKRAAALLKTGNYSVAEVTYDVGFGDLRYFRECFKKEFGVLPQDVKGQSTQSE